MQGEVDAAGGGFSDWLQLGAHLFSSPQGGGCVARCSNYW